MAAVEGCVHGRWLLGRADSAGWSTDAVVQAYLADAVGGLVERVSLAERRAVAATAGRATGDL